MNLKTLLESDIDYQTLLKGSVGLLMNMLGDVKISITLKNNHVIPGKFISYNESNTKSGHPELALLVTGVDSFGDKTRKTFDYDITKIKLIKIIDKRKFVSNLLTLVKKDVTTYWLSEIKSIINAVGAGNIPDVVKVLKYIEKFRQPD